MACSIRESSGEKEKVRGHEITEADSYELYENFMSILDKLFLSVLLLLAMGGCFIVVWREQKRHSIVWWITEGFWAMLFLSLLLVIWN